MINKDNDENLKKAIDQIIAHKHKTSDLENKAEIFEFEKDENINYVQTFSNLRNKKAGKKFTAKSDYKNNAPSNTTDLKTKLYSNGYKLRAYQRANMEDFYSMNYFLSNKLNLYCTTLSMLFAILMVGINWICFNQYLNLATSTYLIIMACCMALPLFYLISFLVKPTKRKKAEFSFKLALLNAVMVCLVGIVIMFLTAFFGLGAEFSNWKTLILPIIFPSIIMATIPISVFIYYLLFKSKKFHIN